LPRTHAFFLTLASLPNPRLKPKLEKEGIELVDDHWLKAFFSNSGSREGRKGWANRYT
jgi:hypothetical protein